MDQGPGRRLGTSRKGWWADVRSAWPALHFRFEIGCTWILSLSSHWHRIRRGGVKIEPDVPEKVHAAAGLLLLVVPGSSGMLVLFICYSCSST